MTVFPKDNKCLKTGTVKPKEEIVQTNAQNQTMTDWTKVVDSEHHLYAGKLKGKHNENETKLVGTEKREDDSKEQDTTTELRLKKGKVEGEEEMQERKSEDTDAKPSHSYIALIAMAILSKPGKKVLLGDIYTYISEKFPYYRSKDKSWRNSIRHNLSLNECFIKAGRSENGKGNYWAIHPANLDDFANGDFRRRRARRRVRKSHSTLCTRYAGLPFPQHAQTAAFLNYRSEYYPHHPVFITPFNMQNCVRKSSYAIDSLLASRVPTALANPAGLQSPVHEYNQVSAAPMCSTALLRGYSTATPYSTLTASPGDHTLQAYPLAFSSNSMQTPSESWQETWKKLKAQFQPTFQPQS